MLWLVAAAIPPKIVQKSPNSYCLRIRNGHMLIPASLVEKGGDEIVDGKRKQWNYERREGKEYLRNRGPISLCQWNKTKTSASCLYFYDNVIIGTINILFSILLSVSKILIAYLTYSYSVLTAFVFLTINIKKYKIVNYNVIF